MIYLDSTALMKLVRNENETAALSEWLREQPETPEVTSELGPCSPRSLPTTIGW